MGKNPSNSMRVCSKHFLFSDYIPSRCKSLKITAVPSQNLPIRTHDKEASSPVKKQQAARKRRAEDRDRNRWKVSRVIDESEECSVGTKDLDLTQDVQDAVEYIVQSMEANVPKVTSVGTQVNMPACKCHSQLREKKVTLVDILTDSDTLYTFTGVRCYDTLNTIVECLEDILPASKTRQKDLPLKNRVLLTLIRMNINFKALGALFGLSRQTCANYFYNMCPLIRTVLEPMISIPDQSLFRENLPVSFEKYRCTRIVLNCAETAVEKCKCLKCRILTYSHYKKGHTVKWLIGIAPSGLIIFLSKAYGSRASDKFIVADSGVLDKLDMTDGVMVDKGFRIDKECIQRGLKLLRPPFLSEKQQLSFEDAMETAHIAHARVHVERVIQRVREFDIISGPVPWTFVPYFEDCLVIAAGLTNLSPPVINIDKFL